MTVVLLIAGFALISVGALLFTNAVEWAGKRLDLGAGAVGSVLAAVGTALPESLIPIVAVLAGAEGEQVAIGAIVGAPFMLGTVAMLMIAASAHVFSERRDNGAAIGADPGSVRRDLGLFLPAFAAGIGLGLVGPLWIKLAGAALLLLAYVLHVRQTLRRSGDSDEDEHDLKPLHFDLSKEDPPNGWEIGIQFVVGLAAVIGGAELFVEEIQQVAKSVGVPPLVLALVLAPLATELPEKLNSVIWMRAGKDTLAVGNVTGAMAFQATIPVALGLVITDWDLSKYAVAAGVLALAGGALAWWRLERRRAGGGAALAWAGLFAALIAFVVAS